MIKGLKRAVLSAVMLATVLGAASPALADDLAERRRLVAELMETVPYSEADAERDAVTEVAEDLRGIFKDGFTPYAEQEAAIATLEAWRKQPPIIQLTRELLETKLTIEELREAVAFTQSPLAVKTRTMPARTATESEAAYIARMFTPQELDAFVAMITRPAIQKYMTTLKAAAEPLGNAFGEDLGVSLHARCAGRTAPLPWCK